MRNCDGKRLKHISRSGAATQRKELHGERDPFGSKNIQQIREAFPFDEAPRYLLHDRDSIYSKEFSKAVKAMGIMEVKTAWRCPWQNPYCERVIGAIRRECLDHIIPLNERHLRRTLRNYQAYYNESRTHLSLNKDAPNTRPAELPSAGARIVSIPHLGGLHHRYARMPPDLQSTQILITLTARITHAASGTAMSG